MLLVKSNILGTILNIQFCLNLVTYKFLFIFSIIIEFSTKPFRDPTSDPPGDPDLGSALRLGITGVE